MDWSVPVVCSTQSECDSSLKEEETMLFKV